MRQSGRPIEFMSVADVPTEIGIQTIAKDTLCVLEAAGIDVSVFKAHSTRMTAASKAVDEGVQVSDVMCQGKWLSFSVFEQFYNRSTKVPNFAALVLTPQVVGATSEDSNSNNNNINNNNQLVASRVDEDLNQRTYTGLQLMSE